MKKKIPLRTLKRQCDALWSRAVLKRDPSCRLCGGKPSRDPHHIFAKSRHAALRYDLRNGVGLCKGCHMQTHHDPMRPALVLERQMKNTIGALLIAASDITFTVRFNRERLELIKAGLENI